MPESKKKQLVNPHIFPQGIQSHGKDDIAVTKGQNRRVFKKGVGIKPARKRPARKSAPEPAPTSASPGAQEEKEENALPQGADVLRRQEPGRGEREELTPLVSPAGRDRYFEAVGRRKTAVARVRLFTRTGPFTVNEKPYGAYFPTLEIVRESKVAPLRARTDKWRL